MTLKQALWEIVRDENIIITNQNIDWLLDRAEKRANDNTDKNKLKGSILERKEKLDKLGESELLINPNKSNNFEVKSNNELFKQALVEGVNRHIDKTIEIEVITYEQDRFNHFINLMEKAQKQYDRLYKRYKDSPYLFEGTTLLSDAGRELQFYKDVIAMLEQGNRKQSGWISVEDRLPTLEEKDIGLVGIVNGNNGKIRFMDAIICVDYDFDEKKWFSWDYDLTDCKVEYWMPLPEAPKMKGGEE